jgi:hypothetical protein
MTLPRLPIIRPGWIVLTLVALVLYQTASAREPRSPDRAGTTGTRRPEILSGTFAGMVVTLFVPRQVVQSWLPQGLHVAGEYTNQDHPVIILFGSIDDLTREKRVTIKPRFGRHYLETFVAIPYLKLDSAPQAKPVFHFVRVYSDSARGTTQGIKKYGWPKIYTPIQATDTSYRILREGSTAIFEAEIQSNSVQTIDPRLNSLQRIRDMLAQPMVLKHEGAFHAYAFDFHLEKANLVSLGTTLELRDGFLPQFKLAKRSIPGIAGADLGAFYMECRYTKTPL